MQILSINSRGFRNEGGNAKRLDNFHQRYVVYPEPQMETNSQVFLNKGP